MIGDRKLLTKPSKPGDPCWDNEQSDLIVHSGDIINDNMKRYSVISLLGKGTFGQVLNCIDQETGRNVAIKISKSLRVYYNCSRIEVQVLEKLKQLNQNYFVQMYSSFIFKQHHCIVLELLGRNLYEMLKIRNFCGFNHYTIKNISRQVLEALIEMSKIGVVHCDLKPENILVEDLSCMKIKLIDFGSSFYHFRENSFYVQSRYYRAPEVLMNIAYNSSVDIWSFICIVFELYTGRPLFPGKSNNDQLARIFYLLEDKTLLYAPNSKILNDLQCKDAFLSKEDIKTIINNKYEIESDKKDNFNFYEFLFLVLKVRPIERPGPMMILNHVYLREFCVDRTRKITADSSGIIEGRDQHHPPPQASDRRRHTNYTTKIKDKFQSSGRKKSYFHGSYKSQ